MKKALCSKNEINRYYIQQTSNLDASFVLSFFRDDVSGNADRIARAFSWVRDEEEISTNAFYLFFLNKDEVGIGDLTSPPDDPCEMIFRKEDLLEGMRQWVQALQENKNKIILELSEDNKIHVYAED